MEIQRIDRTAWERALPAEGFEVFHTPAALDVLDAHTPGELHLLAGYKGERPAALLPVVVRRPTVGTVLLSPPPSMGVPRLGPLLMPASPKRRKHERLNRTFTEGVLERLDVDRASTMFRVVCSPSYADPRPYSWQGLDVNASFTYSLGVEGRSTDDLLASFSKSLRREIRDGEELDLTVEVVDGSDVSAAASVHEETRTRYEEQGRGYPLSWEYVRDLTRALGADDRCRIYVARDEDGAFLGGITVLYSNDAAYFWQGGTRTTHENVSINSLLHWRVVEDLVEDPPRESVTRYDLVGANTERLCRYKSKFGASLVPYYTVESGGARMRLAKRAYEFVKR
jgi:hypothetical protein